MTPFTTWNVQGESTCAPQGSNRINDERGAIRFNVSHLEPLFARAGQRQNQSDDNLRQVPLGVELSSFFCAYLIGLGQLGSDMRTSP